MLSGPGGATTEQVSDATKFVTSDRTKEDSSRVTEWKGKNWDITKSPRLSSSQKKTSVHSPIEYLLVSIELVSFSVFKKE